MFALISEERFDKLDKRTWDNAIELDARDIGDAAIETNESWMAAFDRARALGGGIYVVAIPEPGEKVDYWHEEEC